jgi:hypothetical protein
MYLPLHIEFLLNAPGQRVKKTVGSTATLY